MDQNTDWPSLSISLSYLLTPSTPLPAASGKSPPTPCPPRNNLLAPHHHKQDPTHPVPLVPPTMHSIPLHNHVAHPNNRLLPPIKPHRDLAHEHARVVGAQRAVHSRHTAGGVSVMQQSVPVGGPEDGDGGSPEPMLEMGTVDDSWKTLKPERVGPKGWKGGIFCRCI